MSTNTHARITAELRQSGCVFAEEEADLLITEAANPAQLAAMVQQRVIGLPLEHILGWADFDGHRIAVGAGVFVPRHRTEYLVQQAALLTRPGDTVVDLCCGSGALGVALAAKVPRLQLHAADIDPVEVDYACRNLEPLHGHVYMGDLFEPLPKHLMGRIDTLLANVPYVPTAAIRLLPAEARIHEPAAALDGGADGLDILRRVVLDAATWLAPGGHMLTEVSDHQIDDALIIFSNTQLTPRIETSDELNATVLIATKAA